MSGEPFTLYTAQSLKTQVPPEYPDIIGDSYGAFRQPGLVVGAAVFAITHTGPVTATGAPNLHANTQLFTKTDLGIAATNIGPLGNISIARKRGHSRHAIYVPMCR